MKIVIVNAFGDGNVGGAAITLAAVRLAKELDESADVSIVKVNPQTSYPYTLSVYPETRVLEPALPYEPGTRISSLATSLIGAIAPNAVRNANPTIQAITSADVVVAKGGFVFRERGAGIGSLLSGWFTAWPFFLAARGTPRTVAYSASVGPFTTRRSRLLSRLMLRWADLVCPRDPESELRARADLSIPEERILAMPDCVFGLAEDPVLVADAAPEVRDRLTLIPRDLKGDEWRTFLHAARSALEKTDTDKVTVVVQASEDLNAADRLASEMGLPSEAIRECTDPREVVRVCQESCLVVSCRMHGAIFAAIAHSPLVLFDIDRGKAKPVLEPLGMDRFLIPMNTSSATIDRLLDDALTPATREQLVNGVDATQAAARTAMASIAAEVRS